MHSINVLVWYLRVNGLKREWWIDLPELTSIRLDKSAFYFDNIVSSELIMRSGCDEMNWWIDLPKLTTLTTDKDSNTFHYPRIITLEGMYYHFILTNRHALSHYCYSFQEECFRLQEDRSYQEFLSLPSLIPRHHSRSPTLSQIPSFFHTRFIINSLRMSHSHFITLYIITPHSSAIPNRGMRVDVSFQCCQFLDFFVDETLPLLRTTFSFLDFRL